MPVVNRNEDLNPSATVAVYCERLNELDMMIPEEPHFGVIEIEIETEQMRELILKNAAIVRELINGDELYPEVLTVLSRYFDIFNEDCEGSFWRMTGCTLKPEGRKFRTSDGYILHEDGYTWSDGDLTFDSGADGMPVEDGGEPVEGSLLD